MVATTLRAGDIAIVGYNAEDTNNPDKDTISFVLMRGIGSGTQIFFTDRNWNGSAFAGSSADENTFTYTAGADLAAGTIIQITTAQLNAAGIDLVDTGETIYAYQGAINAPTTFLFAADIADSNNTFNGNLTGTGLSVANNTAVAIDEDNASWAGRGHNHNAIPMLDSIADSNDWVGNDNSLQVAPNGNYSNTPDQQLWVGGSGGGHALVRLDRDGASFTAEEITHIYQNSADNAGTTTVAEGLFHPTDIVFDTVSGKMFVADSDGNGHNRIVQFDIATMLANPGAAPSGTILYSDTNVGTGIVSLTLDKPRGLIYFGSDDGIYRIDYNTANQTPELAVYMGNNIFVQDFVLNLDANGNGTAYIVNSSINVSFGADNITRNFIYQSTGLTPTSTSPGVTANATQMPMNPNDTAVGGVASTNPDAEAFPKEHGVIKGIHIDPDTDILYFTSMSAALDHDNNSGTAAQTQFGGIWSYATISNPTGNYTSVWRQDGVNGTDGLIYYIEVDTINNKYYVSDITGGPGVAADNQEVWVGNLSGGAPTLFATVANIQGLSPLGLDLQNAPTLTGSGNAGLAVTEASSAPNSGETARVDLYPTLTAGDVDTPNTGDELTGAIVRVDTGFVYEAASTAGGHTGTQDYLRIDGNLSGTVTGGSGITYSYDVTTGMMTLSGAATTAEYVAAINLVTFSTSGDNVTGDGLGTTRTIRASVFDGLLYSDEISVNVSVTGINDAPVNTVGGAMNFTEDTTGFVGQAVPSVTNPVNAVTGLSIADADADADTENFTVTLTVAHGTLSIRTDVTGGLVAGDVTGNGTASLTLTGTQNEINTTLAATTLPAQGSLANGLVYTPTANFNGADTLTIVTNDQGNNGNDPGNSGTGTTEQDSDNKTLNVADVNDAPTVGDGTEDSPTILEDTPYTNLNAPNVATLFGGQFADTTDIQFHAVNNPTGSTGDTLAGIAITVNGSNANGNWQYWDGDSWENIGAASQAAAKTFTAATLIRFNPTLNYNGAAPTLTAHLIETGGPAITNAGTVNLNPVGTATGGTTVYSTNTVVLGQAITAVNDAPVNTVGGSLDIQEDDPATNVTGVSVFDLEADPANDLISVTLDVDHGTLAILTNVAGGIVAGDIVSQDADTISILATQNEINTTLAAAGGLTYDSDANYFGGDTLEVTTSDLGNTGQDPVPGTGTGSDEQDVDSKVINIAAVDDPATTAADADDVDEDDTVNVDVLANDSDIDTTLAVAEIDGQAVAPGGTVTLTGSGATVKLELDGTLTYDPNDQFNYLITAAQALATGAVNDTATDTFSYELAGGETANVTITVHGVASPEDVLMGDGTDNTINGTAGTDFFYVMQPGTETLDGMGGNDAFLFGPYLDATDDVDGGAGTGDQLGIQGDYSGGLTLGANNLVGIETFVLLSGTDTRFGDPGTNLYDYDITTVDANVPNNGLLKVQFNTLVAGEDVSFDGSAETGGAFFFYAGQGTDTLIGGGGNDAFFFGHNGSAPAFTAADQVNGGGGNNDQLGLRGDYANLITFGSTTMQNVEVLVAISSTDARFGNTGSNFHYNLKTHDDNVGATKTLSVTGAMLTATEGLTFDGSSELDGQFDIKGGKGTDVLTGGALADLLFGNEGQDNLTGGGGNDTFRYRLAADSAIGDEDQILDFTGGDKIDLTMMDANSNTGANDAFTFSNDGTFHSVAGELRAYESSPGTWFVEGDTNGNGSADFAIQVTLTNPLAPLTAADFNL